MDRQAYFRKLQGENNAEPEIPTAPGQTWTKARMLGQGAGGRAYLWNLVDQNQNVVDQVVLKYAYPSYLYHVLKNGPGKGQLREVYIQKILAPDGTPPANVFTVPILGAETMPWEMNAWRFYMPYMAAGTLDDLIKDHEDPIPEPFAWYLFHRLASAAVAMDERPPNTDHNYVVVHCDLKTENIFMDKPGSLGKDSDFIVYPPAYVADFGNSHVTYEGDPESSNILGWSTLGWAAPEIYQAPNDQRAGHREEWQAPAHSYTNVWQIGFVMLTLLRMGRGEQISWEAERRRKYAPSYRKDPNRPETMFSDDLLDIVHACLRYEVKERPSPQQLLAAINAQMYKHSNGVERWGTLDWFNEQMREDTQGDDHGDGHGSQEYGDKNDKGKRKARPEETVGPVSKRTKIRTPEEDEAVRQRRLKLVAMQIKEGHRYREPEVNDGQFVLDNKYHLVRHSVDNLFDIERFFSRPSPKPLVHRKDNVKLEEWGAAMIKAERKIMGRGDEDDDEDEPMGAPGAYNFRRPPGEAAVPSTPGPIRNRHGDFETPAARSAEGSRGDARGTYTDPISLATPAPRAWNASNAARGTYTDPVTLITPAPRAGNASLARGTNTDPVLITPSPYEDTRVNDDDDDEDDDEDDDGRPGKFDTNIFGGPLH